MRMEGRFTGGSAVQETELGWTTVMFSERLKSSRSKVRIFGTSVRSLPQQSGHRALEYPRRDVEVTASATRGEFPASPEEHAKSYESGPGSDPPARGIDSPKPFAFAGRVETLQNSTKFCGSKANPLHRGTGTSPRGCAKDGVEG